VASETGIVNVGLRLIGQQPITSLTDGSPSANAANDIYEELRDDILRSHPWNFATKRVKLARSTTAPAFGFDYAYPLPSDWLRTMSVHNNDAGAGTIVFQEEQIGATGAIVTSADEVYLRYVARVTDPNLMSADFRRVLEYGLARDLAVPLASSNTLRAENSKEFTRAMSRARSADGMGGFPQRRPIGSWTNQRRGYRRTWAD
jgi:hypothetical protein